MRQGRLVAVGFGIGAGGGLALGGGLKIGRRVTLGQRWRQLRRRHRAVGDASGVVAAQPHHLATPACPLLRGDLDDAFARRGARMRYRPFVVGQGARLRACRLADGGTGTEQRKRQGGAKCLWRNLWNRLWKAL
ncbi:hypothetical protein D3C72_1021650 [compost metagenome]